MKRIQLNELRNKNLKVINQGEGSFVYLLNDGRIFKAFTRDMLDLLRIVSVDVEFKILDSDKVKLNPAIIKPEVAVYDGYNFVGYIMEHARGVDYNKYGQSISINDRTNLYKYADFHYKLESIIKSTPNVVYPDICTCDNIYVSDGEIQLIDYDGMQVDNYRSLSMSTNLGVAGQFFGSKKYMDDNDLFTKELDKRSLIILYFLDAFNINLNKVGMAMPYGYGSDVVTLDDVFGCINLLDDDIKHKVWKIFNDKESNEYLGEDVYRLAQDYEMTALPYKDNMYLKKLVRK